MIYGLGVDIIEIDRIENAIKKWGDHFVNHVFCPEEILYAKDQGNPYQHYAARFAAKEAVFKAISDRPDIKWKDIKILNDENGKPFCVLKNTEFSHKILISISHNKNYAVANAIITS